MSSLEEVVLQCPLSQARLRELCEHLIHSDCDINEGGRHSMTPLHLAIQVRGREGGREGGMECRCMYMYMYMDLHTVYMYMYMYVIL